MTGQSVILNTSASANSTQESRFGSLVAAEVAYLGGVSTSQVVVYTNNVTTDSTGNVAVVFQLIGSTTTKSDLEATITTLKNALTNQYGAATRLYVSRNFNSSVELGIEGDNLFAPPNNSLAAKISAILAWIRSNLAIVLPVAIVVSLLLVYKLWYDHKHSGDKQIIAGVNDEEDYVVRARKDKSRKDHDVEKKKKKKKRVVEKKRKGRELRNGEQEMETEFGVRVVRKNDPAPAYEEEDRPHPDNLPPNWSVQYFDDGTKFYFNSVTNDISQEKPKA